MTYKPYKPGSPVLETSGYRKISGKRGSSGIENFIQHAYDVFKAVDYLHKQSPPIIHRDLKPENILMSQGHLKIADFGWSNLKDKERTTFCGTPEYLAPEMLMEKGHNEKLDVWTLGILLYEMLVGEPPFTPKDIEGMHQNQIFEKLKTNIVVFISITKNGKVSYPNYLSIEAKDLLQNLLVQKPSDRLSCHDALRHKFFVKNGLDIEFEEKMMEERRRERRKMEEKNSEEKRIEEKKLDETKPVHKIGTEKSLSDLAFNSPSKSQVGTESTKDLIGIIDDLRLQLARRDEELLRMTKMYASEKDRNVILMMEIKQKNSIIDNMAKMNDMI